MNLWIVRTHCLWPNLPTSPVSMPLALMSATFLAPGIAVRGF